jgi:hypothetical protein
VRRGWSRARGRSGGARNLRIEIRPEVTALAPIKNPVNPKQSFDVLEVWADIYKGRYRMRLLYYTNIPGQCVLMGQEILEYADL